MPLPKATQEQLFELDKIRALLHEAGAPVYLANRHPAKAVKLILQRTDDADFRDATLAALSGGVCFINAMSIADSFASAMRERKLTRLREASKEGGDGR